MFLDILAKIGHFRWPNLAESVKRHIYILRPFIWAYSQDSTTIRYKDTAWKDTDIKPLFLAKLTTSGRVFLTEIVKRHIYGQRPIIWAYKQVSMTFPSKVLARTSSSLEKPLFFLLFLPVLQFPVGCFDRNGQKAHLRTKTFHLSLKPSLYSCRPMSLTLAENENKDSSASL